jgi:photosystem II stability/assembly factor-like uncharacterized protein
MSDCVHWFLVLGILILAGSAASGALLHVASATASSPDSNSAGKTGGVSDLLEHPALQVHNPERCVLLGIAKSGDRLVAVGERGIIALSDDIGQTWRQAKVLTSVTLTAVTFPARDIGWAIGHAGTVLHTTDGGETWTRQLDGVAAARIAYDDAQAFAASAGKNDPAAARFISDAKRLIDDGPDKPFLDIHFSNEKEGIIVGAYGLIFHTGDGGHTWQSWMTRVINPDGFHFYTVQQTENEIYLAGEQGVCCRSLDAGKSFQKIDTGYRGSYFASTMTSKDMFVIAGMRGHVYGSIDRGATFGPMEVPVPVSIMACLSTEEGVVVLVNQAGQMLQNSLNRPDVFQVLGVPRLKVMVASMIQLKAQILLGVGNNGVVRIPLSNVIQDISEREH